MAWVNGKWVVGPDEYQSQDYKNFLSLSPEQQQAFGAAGGTFDNKGNLGLAANSYTPPANSGSWTDTVAGWFKPEGPAGTSTGGNLLGAIGTGIGAASGLAGMYYTKKNYDLQKDQQNYLKQREAESDARKRQFAANAGGGASY